jgi:hypothetical protein
MYPRAGVGLGLGSAVAISFEVNGGTEAARIDSSGVFRAHQGFLSDAGTVSGGVCFTGTCNGDLATVGLRITNSSNNVSAKAIQFLGWNASETGSVTTNVNATSYNTSSDYRLKENIQDVSGSGAFIDALQPRKWNWKADGSAGTGFLAHELQAVSPSSVTGEKDAVDAEGRPIYQAVEYGSAEVIAMLVAEVKSLRARVAQLEQGA